MQMTKVMTLRGREPVSEPLHYTACGLDDVYLVNGFAREQIDGEDAVSIEDLDGLWKAIGLALVKGRKTLTPKEVRYLRHHMDLTQSRGSARSSACLTRRWRVGKRARRPSPARPTGCCASCSGPLSAPSRRAVKR